MTSAYNLEEDPYGLNYGMAKDGSQQWGSKGVFFPDELPLTECDERQITVGGPRLGSWDPYWIHGDTSTSYEAEEGAIASETDAETRPSETQGGAPPVNETQGPPPEDDHATQTEEGGDGGPTEQPEPQASEVDDDVPTPSRDPGESTGAGGSVESQGSSPSPTDDSGAVSSGPRWSLCIAIGVLFLAL